MKKSLGLAFAALWLNSSLLWAQPVPVAGLEQDRAAQASNPVSMLDSSLFYEVLIGEITAQDGQPAAGFALIFDAAGKTNDAQLYQRATDIALQARSGDAALQAATAWKAAQPTSRDANRYILQILIALNRIADTLEPLKSEIQTAPEAERPAVLDAIPRAYARASDRAVAASVVESAVAAYADAPATASLAWTTIARMRLAAGNSVGAIEAAQRGQAADLRAEGPAVVALELMDSKTPAAEAMVKAYLDQPGPPSATAPEIRLAYARSLLEEQRYTDAMAQLTMLARSTPEYPDSWLLMGSLQLQDNQLAKAQASLEKYLALAQQVSGSERKAGTAQAYLMLSQLAEKRKDFSAAEGWLGKIENSAELTQAQTRRASILARQGKVGEGRRILQQLPDRTPEEVQAKINAEIAFLREFKMYAQARELLAVALAKTPDDADLLYEQSMVVEKLGLIEEMERLLRRVIALKPDFHQAYNALGYSLADRSVRLLEARELVKRAVELAPTDPFIQDSLGWVEFRLGNVAEAARILDAAYRVRPDAEIAAHLGEVLWSLGQRDRARIVWKEGQMMNADNETLAETIKRIAVKP